MSIQIRRDILQDWPVLVVEDDPASMDVASYMLRHYGAKVSTAVNGEEGLKQARATQPRFILTDMSMPIMDGWTMLEEMKKDRKLSSIPVIALTAHAMPGDREKAIAAGCHNYLTKPLTAATFINNLLNLLVDIPEIKEALAASEAKAAAEAAPSPADKQPDQSQVESSAEKPADAPAAQQPTAANTNADSTQPTPNPPTSNSLANPPSAGAQNNPTPIEEKS